MRFRGRTVKFEQKPCFRILPCCFRTTFRSHCGESGNRIFDFLIPLRTQANNGKFRVQYRFEFNFLLCCADTMLLACAVFSVGLFIWDAATPPARAEPTKDYVYSDWGEKPSNPYEATTREQSKPPKPTERQMNRKQHQNTRREGQSTEAFDYESVWCRGWPVGGRFALVAFVRRLRFDSQPLAWPDDRAVRCDVRLLPDAAISLVPLLLVCCFLCSCCCCGLLCCVLCSYAFAVCCRYCQRLLGRFFTFQLTVRENHRVIKEGPYRYVRHPSYALIMLYSQTLNNNKRDLWNTSAQRREAVNEQNHDSRPRLKHENQLKHES